MPRTAQLRALGNGVMPKQAAGALRHPLDDLTHLHRPPCHPLASPTQDRPSRVSRRRSCCRSLCGFAMVRFAERRQRWGRVDARST
ncbi:hypothetical protein DL991_32320 [Amycolatopsis sp. WAC 01375]|nr:hypothetical protein DL991_32320 [Amycolatopsis sp. WAC 01375]RSN27228.1 hypothetical protein DL990_28890 [Amycolatopsis sp. WAC 01416]